MTKPVLPSVWDRRWKYTNARDTDIRKTFAKHGFKPTKKGRRNEQSNDLVSSGTERDS
jgi:hypothetical protein